MTDNLKRFPEMPSCCCYGLIDGKILRWCGTQRVRFLLWQKQLRAIVRRSMSSLCRRKRLGEMCPQAAKIVYLYCKIPSFIWHQAECHWNPESSRPMHRKCWNWHAWSSCSPCSWRCRLFHLKGGYEAAGREVLITPFRCRWKVNVPWRRNSNARFDFLEKRSGKWWIYWWYQICLLCFFICLHGGLMWYQFTQLSSDVK